MKSFAITSLVAAQLMVAAQPVAAADLVDERGTTSQRHGAFAGARLRLPLGGDGDRKARAGVTVAPVATGANGNQLRRFGEGLELRFVGQDKPELAFGGRPVAQLVQGQAAPEGRKAGVSTTKGLLIVGGVVILTLGAVALLLVSQE